VIADDGARSWRVAVCLLLMLTLLAPGILLARTAQAAADGVLDGQVVNGTSGGPVPANLNVTVHILQDRNRLGQRDVQTDAEGRFHVEGLETASGMLYFPIVQDGDVAYFPEKPASFDGSTSTQTSIQVFEKSDDPTNLAFDRANMLIMNVSPTALTVMEMGAVVNGSDRTYDPDPQVSGSDRTLRFNLPPGATQITPQIGLPTDTLETTPDGFATTDPVRPGRREFAFSYQLPYDSSSLDLTRSFALPVGTVMILVPDRGIDLVGPGISYQGSSELGGQRYRQYVGQGVEANSPVRFRLTNLPAPFFARPRDLGLAVAAVASLVLIAGLLVVVRRHRSGHVAPADIPPAASPETADEHRRLIHSLAELDEHFAAGDIAEADYRSRREAEKARLLMLVGSAPDAG